MILANVDNGGCVPVVLYGCMESLAFNYNPYANTPDTCIAYLWCTDPTMFNYDQLANTDDGSCITVCLWIVQIAIMFNFNPFS